MITAVTILKLVDAKKLKLDDFVTSILPEFHTKKQPSECCWITEVVYEIMPILLMIKAFGSKKKTLTNQDVLTLLATKNIGLESTPETRFGYCNTNYALLALIIEKGRKRLIQKCFKN